MEFGWLTILPPIIAIVLALITKEVISSLLIGILSGTLIYARFDVIQAVDTTFGIMAEKLGGNASIILFLALLGALVCVITKAGGSAAYGEWAAKKIKMCIRDRVNTVSRTKRKEWPGHISRPFFVPVSSLDLSQSTCKTNMAHLAISCDKEYDVVSKR